MEGIYHELLKFFDWINNLGATAMLPIIMFIMGIAFKVKPGQALKSAIRVGWYFWFKYDDWSSHR